MKKTVKVLYEDESLIVFDKPSGLLVIPSPKKENNTLSSIVNKEFGDHDKRRLYPCHRLDRDTSGAIIFAKGKKNQQCMMQVFKESGVNKMYIAFVRGKLKKSSGKISGKIKDFHQRHFAKHSQGKMAVTQYKVDEIKNQFTVVHVMPITGRTNQIRIHFAQMGHPLLGERVYAYRKDFPVNFRRLALHACELAWKHPIDKKKIVIRSPLPNDMKSFLLN